MTPIERLTAYEFALKDYQNAIGKNGNYLLDSRLHEGFCRYFIKVQGIDVYGCIAEVLPELYFQKPNPAFDSYVWFPEGELSPRIECLKRAIALTKKTYNL